MMTSGDFEVGTRDPGLALARILEPRARRAWPALEQGRVEGWILRAARGVTRRSNSVHADGDVADMDAALAAAGRWFAARQLPLRVYVTPSSRPAGLEERLDAQGWTAEGGALVQVATLPGPSAGSGARIESDLTADWLERLASWRTMDPQTREVHGEILRRVPAPCAFVTVGDDRPRALGLGVVDDGWVGLFDLVTDPAARRRGWGTALLDALLAWGRDAGAVRAYLQVTAENGPALAMYARAGFRTAYAYTYRRAPG